MKPESSHEQYMPNPSSAELEKLVSVEAIYAQMVLDEILINRLKEDLVKKIDDCLDARDKKNFMRYSKMYSEMNR